MKVNDPMLALLYHQYREGRRLTPPPAHSPPVAAVLALLGIVVTSVALAGGLALFVALCSMFSS